MSHPALSELAALLRELQIDWVLIGAYAANRYRSAARTTIDVDLLLARVTSLDTLIERLRQGGWMVNVIGDPSEIDMLRLQHPRHGVADLLIAGSEYQQRALQRKVSDGSTVPPTPVLSVEDVIIHKLIAGRFQDLADIESILSTRPLLDAEYLHEWIQFWELSHRWRQVFDDQGSHDR